MSGDGTVEMTGAEIGRFLETNGFGVLSLAATERPYAIPVSYAYDEIRGEFLLRLGHLDTSEKDTYLDESTPARLVVFDGTAGPRSVICDGELTELEKADLSPHRIEVLGAGETPAFGIWEADKERFDVSVHCLQETELSGRKAVSAED
jgi:nitroimidazol reductase NimA-like FMN-containing flavoprotein (pyridoxamine 5'-phosphate oxidase superfamily)